MTGYAADRIRAPGLEFAADRFRMNVHGDADSHIDALCHVIYDDKLYNGVASTRSRRPAHRRSRSTRRTTASRVAASCSTSQARGVSWLEPGDHVTVDDLVAAEGDQGLRAGRGDLLFVRVGHSRRRTEVGPWNAANERAGLDPNAMEFVADRQVAVLGSDGNNDTASSTTEGVAFPVHVLAINAMGVHLLDYLQFEDLVPLCEEANAGRSCA